MLRVLCVCVCVYVYGCVCVCVCEYAHMHRLPIQVSKLLTLIFKLLTRMVLIAIKVFEVLFPNSSIALLAIECLEVDSVK